MKHYIVISPEIESGNYEYEPSEFFRCVAEVHAENRHDARVFALRMKDMKEWVRNCRWDNDSCPLAGLEVQEAQCSHGKCWCSECIDKHGECQECMDESEKYWQEQNKPKE